MKIEDVKFIQRGDGQVGLVMPGRYWVTRQTFLHAHADILANWDAINWSVKQTAKSMMGAGWGDPAVWGYNQALGRCVKFFVTRDMLPLPLEVARKRNGDPYKRGSAKYVPRGSNQAHKPMVIPTRLVKRVGSIDPRTIRIDPAMLSPATVIKTPAIHSE